MASWARIRHTPSLPLCRLTSPPPLVLRAHLATRCRIVHQWDDDGDGEISKTEFRKHIAKFTGTVGKPESKPGGEIDLLFDALDDDGSGAMDTKEMRHALTLLKEDGKRVSDKPKQLKKRADECGATAKKAQIQLYHLLQEDRDAESEAQQRAEQERAEREAKAAAVKEAKAAAILAKLAEEEAKQAEFSSRVNSRR